MSTINIKHMNISQVVKSCFTLHPKTLNMIFAEVQEIIPDVKKGTVSQVCHRLVKSRYADINKYNCFVRGWRFRITYDDKRGEIRVNRRNGFPENRLYFHDDCVAYARATVETLSTILHTIRIILDLDEHDYIMDNTNCYGFKGLEYHI